jgi:hypothetical protein
MRETGRLAIEPWMTHERLDDQVMMINLETGAYFALERPAADCWTALSDGADFDTIVTEIVTHFDVPLDQAEADLDVFIASLIDESIVRWTSDAPAPRPHVVPNGDRLEYRPPQIEKHDDLEELLLLDPIHDVSPEGWPAVG